MQKGDAAKKGIRPRKKPEKTPSQVESLNPCPNPNPVPNPNPKPSPNLTPHPNPLPKTLHQDFIPNPKPLTATLLTFLPQVSANKKVLYIWPLELIHLRETGSKTGFDLTGPDKIMSIMIEGVPEIKQAYDAAVKFRVRVRVRGRLGLVKFEN